MQAAPRTQCRFAVSNCFDDKFWDVLRSSNPCFGHVDIVSVQFALHYACASVSIVHRLLNNMFDVLRPGGVFIATIVDGEELENRLRSKKLSNSLFRIEVDPSGEFAESWLSMSDPESHLPIGLKYQFHLEALVDSPEYSIPYPLLLAEAKSIGFVEVPEMTFRFGDVIQAHASSSVAKHALKGKGLSPDEIELVRLYRTVCLAKPLPGTAIS